MIGGVVGGGFGAKNDPHADPITAVASLYPTANRKMAVDAREEFIASTTARHAYVLQETA